MPVVQIYHHGVSASILPRKNDHERTKRKAAQGWSKSATRNNTKWLRSVSPESFDNDDEFGIAFTLTIRNCPETSEDWKKLREAFVARLRRLGMLRLHWVTEWQRRGVPHLHGIVFFPNSVFSHLFEDEDTPWDEIDEGLRNYWHIRVRRSWITVASEYGASEKGQHLKTVTDIKGWFKYLSKHASRGADHYQRSSSGVPSGWIKTGRVWGHCGDWVTDAPYKINTSNEFYFALRRIVRKWRLSDARTALKESPMLILRNEWMVANPAWFSAKKRITSARKMLKCNDFKKSQVRGISEWIDAHHTLLISELLIAQGYEIYLPEDGD